MQKLFCLLTLGLAAHYACTARAGAPVAVMWTAARKQPGRETMASGQVLEQAWRKGFGSRSAR